MDTLRNGTECSPFDAQIFTTVAIVSAVVGFISLLANSFIIFIILLFKKWRIFSQRLILYLAIAGVSISLTAMLHRADYENQRGTSYYNFCVFSGFFNQISLWMVLCAITSITLSLFMRAFLKSRPEALDRYFVLFIFVFPFTFNWIPFIQLTYGKAGAWCWIRTMDENTCEAFLFGKILQLVLWYLPLYVIILVLITLYCMVILKLYCGKKSRFMERNNLETETERQQVMKEVISLLAYPLIYFILNIPPLINRIHGVVEPDNPLPVLWFLTGIFFPLQGGVVAMIFSLDSETRKRLTWANFKVAFSHIYHSRETSVREYPVIVEADFLSSNREDLLNNKFSN